MRSVVQRVSRGSVEVGGRIVGEIGRGLVALVGIEAGDQVGDRAWMADKLVHLRIFEDAEGKMNLSLVDLGAAGEKPGLLLVPNFTVAGDARKGRRPSFDNAMRPEHSEAEFGRLVEEARAKAPTVDVRTGVFRAEMKVHLSNDGPVTILLDSRATR